MIDGEAKATQKFLGNNAALEVQTEEMAATLCEAQRESAKLRSAGEDNDDADMRALDVDDDSHEE